MIHFLNTIKHFTCKYSKLNWAMLYKSATQRMPYYITNAGLISLTNTTNVKYA